MNPFDLFRTKRSPYSPRTPQTALLGMEREAISPEEFMFLRTNLVPLNIEPYSLSEIERILSKRNISFSLVHSITRILKKILTYEDKEIVQIAAEKLITIESRFSQRIQSYKTLLELEEDEGDKQKLYRLIITTYKEFAQIHRDHQGLFKFYLREAFAYSRAFWEEHLYEEPDGISHVQLLLELDLPSQARAFLHDSGSANLFSHETTTLLDGEIQFYLGRFAETAGILAAGSIQSENSQLVALSYFWNQNAGVD